MTELATVNSGDITNAPSHRVWRRWALRVTAGSLVVIALYAVLGFFVAPWIVKRQVTSELARILDRDVTIEAVSFNPFTLEVAVNGLLIRDRDNPKPLLAFDALTADFAIASITRRGVVITSVKVVKPQASLIRLDANSYNFSDIAAKLNAPRDRPDAAPLRFAIGNIELRDGHLDFDDRPEQTRHEIAAINLAIPRFSNFPLDIETTVEPQFNAVINGDPFVVTGESRPFQDTLETTLRVTLSDVDLPKYLEYVPAALDFKVPSAKLAAALRIRYAKPSAGPLVFLLDGEATITQVSVTDKTGLSLIEFDTLKVGMRRIDLSANTADLSTVQISAPRVAIRRDAAGGLNLAHLVPRVSPDTARDTGTQSARDPPPASPAWQLEIASIIVNDGQVLFADESNGRAFQSKIDGLTVTIDGFSLAPDRPANYSIGLRTDLGVIAQSSGTFTAMPLTAAGRIELSRVRIADYAPYFEQALSVDFPEGTMRASGGYRLQTTAGGTHLTFDGVDGAIESLRMTQRSDGEEMLHIGKLDVTGIDLDLTNRSVAIANLGGVNARAVVRRHADGSINFAGLTASDPARIQDPPARVEAASPWRYAIKKATLDQSSMRFTDDVTAPPVDIAIDAIQLTAGGLSSVADTPGTLQLRSLVNTTGSVATSGRITLAPFALELAVDVAQIDATAFEPYFSPFLNLAVGSGSLFAKGNASFALPASAPATARFDGDITIAELATTDKLTGQDLLRWHSLVLGQVGFTLDPPVIRIGEIALAQFYSRLTITPAGRINLQGLLARPGTPATASSAPIVTNQGTAPQISIGRITLQSGNISFSDQFVKPNFSADLTGVTGAISAITAERAGVVDVQGRIDGSGALEIAGEVNPLARTLYLDIKGSARDIDLPTMTPYSAKYVGYHIDKGKLSIKFAYRIEDQQLTADNNLVLDQLTFGERIDSPDALNIPILLAIALLKDRNGIIDINLPIAGSLDDPAFSLGSVLVRVFSNLIVNAVTSPFALLSMAFGATGDEELGFVEYEAGFATLSTAAEGLLATLAKALTDRQALRLEIGGRTDPAHDREGLRRVKLVDRMLALKPKPPAGKVGVPPSGAAILLDPNEYAHRLTEVYRAADFPRPRNAIGMLRVLPAPEMEQLILANTPVTDDDLRDLARRRAQRVKDYLVGVGGIAAERIFLVAPKLNADDIKDKGKSTRAEFALE